MGDKLPKNFGKIPRSVVPFGDRLSGLCAMELAAAHGDPERVGAMIERLTNSLAFTISMAARGNPEASEEMLTGAISYLYEAATSHQKVAQLLGNSPSNNGGTR